MTPRKPTDNPAQIRGDIEKGRAGGKRPGFDPAAAPLETDAEAGGRPLGHEQVRTSRRTQDKEGAPGDAASYNEAMREPTDPEFPKHEASSGALMIYVGLIAVALLIPAVAVLILYFA